MAGPDAVTGIKITGRLRTIMINWQPLPWSTVVDHYRVYGIQGEGVAVGASVTSISHSGTALAVAGEFDGRTLELRYAPKSYASIPTAYPDAVITLDHGPDIAERWPYLLPGPGDAWAGRKSYTLHWTVDLAEHRRGRHWRSGWSTPPGWPAGWTW